MAPATAKPCLALVLLLAGLALGAHALEELPSQARQRLNAALAAAAKNGPPLSGCGTRPLVIVYGTNPPTDLGPLIEDQPPLPRLPPVRTGADVELHQASASASSCLNQTRRIRGTLVIIDDGGLGPSLPLLSNLQQVGESLIVYGTGGPAASLTSLEGLGALESVGNLALARLPRLATVAGLEGLRAINSLALWRLPELQTLDAMGPVTMVQERVWIENAPKLLSLGRLPPLPPLPPSAPLGETAPKVTRAQGPAPTAGAGAGADGATGLSALRSVGLDLYIQNTDLPSLELPYLATLGGEIALVNNKRLASTQGLRSLASVSAVALIGNALLADVDGFARLTELKGDLSLVRNGAIQSVNGFSGLQKVGLSVDVSSNPALRSLDGLRALQGVGQLLNVAFNPSLEALRGLGGLRSVGADLIVRNNPKMKELSDLGASLQVVGAGPSGGALIVEGNEALASLAPLASPPLQVVRGAVRVREGNGFASSAALSTPAPGGGGGIDASVRALEALSQPNFTFGPGAATGGATGGATMVPATATPPPTTPEPAAAVARPAGPLAALPPARAVTAVDPAPRAAVAPMTPVPAAPAAPMASAAAPFVNTLG